jgi:hypothetical protein
MLKIMQSDMFCCNSPYTLTLLPMTEKEPSDATLQGRSHNKSVGLLETENLDYSVHFDYTILINER